MRLVGSDPGSTLEALTIHHAKCGSAARVCFLGQCMSTDIVWIDASTYQHLIGRLSETMAQKVLREGSKLIPASDTFHTDIFISIRQAQNTYNFLHWVHSDELRATAGWRDTYTVASQPLIRNLMDDLYTITLLLKEPITRERQFRASGIRKGFLYLAAEEARYKGKPE